MKKFSELAPSSVGCVGCGSEITITDIPTLLPNNLSTYINANNTGF